jgi:hypothetical protein
LPHFPPLPQLLWDNKSVVWFIKEQMARATYLKSINSYLDNVNGRDALLKQNLGMNQTKIDVKIIFTSAESYILSGLEPKKVPSPIFGIHGQGKIF